MAPKKLATGGKANAGKKQGLTVPDSEHIQFGDDKKKKKTKATDSTQQSSSEPPKPTARQLVGGASWTGKLPVNLLSELCQRQKWNKPDYSMRQMPARDGSEKSYRSDVTLSRTDPRTKETTTLPPIRLPPTEVHLADQPSALEARHFAATYALFRTQSMKNIHMTLPPKYRDLWKGDFSRLKKQDVEAEQAWRYEEDPFAAEEKRQEILKSIEKRKDDEKKRQETQAKLEGGMSAVLPLRPSYDTKAWEQAPQAVMGQQIRLDVEQIIRQNAVWNPHRQSLSTEQQQQIFVDISKLGFREDHIKEALEYCKDHQEVLEWLLIHIPEDDLPKWTFPSNYNAGVTLASGDLDKDKKLRRLTSAGYPSHLCVQALREHGGDENLAAFTLQEILVPVARPSTTAPQDSMPEWEEETSTLQAIFGENCRISGDVQCSISMSTSTGQPFTAHFRCPTIGYPQSIVPAISVEIIGAPAYVRLSATKQAIQYAQSELLGEVMLYNICQWLETELPNIVEHPGRISDLQMSPTDISTSDVDSVLDKGKAKIESKGRGLSSRQKRRDCRSDQDILERWRDRQATLEQGKMNDIRKKLPAWAKQEAIIQAIESHQVIIISGETGSGKSTQVVQFILDMAVQNLQGSKINVFCTQPRRVAALSLAERVGTERCSKVGDEVGYIIRGESKVSIETKITFVTTGVLLRRLQSNASMGEALTNISHIFVDEVHERSLDTDFLLALLKECILLQPSLKVILMSATIDAEIFSNYFGGLRKVALVKIEGRTFPVQDLYLEDVVGLTNPGLNGTEVGKVIQSFGIGINYELIRDVVLHIDRELGEKPGSILIFLPGTMEIERCLRTLLGNPRILGLPLHASLLPADQRKVFPPAPRGQRKVVAATNVAETSITIEDIVAVVDTGRVKETNYDAISNIVRLEEVWASLAACKQRRGRAGRVREGVCYKLFTKNVEAKMPGKNLPEIQRVPLEQLCLSVKATGPDRDVAEFLSQTLTPPENAAVANALKALHTMSALENGRLTALGIYMAMVPTDLRCAKLLVYGIMFDCFESCLTVASILTVKSPFVSPRAAREEANEARMRFPNSDGDLLLDTAAYDEWANLNQHLQHGEMVDWCSSRYISNQVMRDISTTRRLILDSFKDAGLLPFNYKSSLQSESLLKDHDQVTLLTALVAASLQPQLALISFPSKKYIASMSGAKELDPEARTIKFFIPDESSSAVSTNATPVHSRPGTPKPGVVDSTVADPARSREKMPHLSRVFIHPASCLFSAQTFPRHATHLSYFTKMLTTKPFVRDLTPLNIYSLLFFGGRLELDTLGRGLTVGGIWRVKGWARIGVLISRLRVLLDEELGKTVEAGGVLLGSMNGSKIVPLIRRLLVLNGQDR